MNIRPSNPRPPFRNFGILGALALTAALAFAGEPGEDAAAAARREKNAAVLHLGPAVGNGSFENGLTGWRELSGGLGVVRTVPDGILDQAAEGKAYLHYQMDLAQEAQRKSNFCFDVSVPGAGVSKEHALRLTWQQQGPRADRQPFARIRYTVNLYDNKGKQVGGKQGDVPAPTTRE